MKIGINIDKDVILVAREKQSTACGINYIKEGSILKVARDKEPWRNSVKVFRNKEEEQEDRWYNIDLSKVREATQVEIAMWNKEMYFVESVKTY